MREFDYVVVGAGSSGAVIASRLSENPDVTVLLLEAGTRGSGYFWTWIPVGTAFMIENPKVNWCYESEPNAALGGRPIKVPRGRMLGGSSALNGMIYTRGQRQDYDHWAQLGCKGWSYRDVLPFFKKMESYRGGSDEFRGRDGPIRVTEASKITPFYDLFMASAEKVGIPRNPDYNGADQEGTAMAQASIHKGLRQSTANCYLDPARNRPNLTIRTGTEADRLIMDGKTCVGVRYRIGGGVEEAWAGREVIVSCGTINSPKLLELSGIGQPQLLAQNGIDPVHPLPGVGENLRDHFAPKLKYSITRKHVSLADVGHGWRYIREGLRYALFRKGFVAQSIGTMRVFFRTREGLEAPDAMMVVAPFIPEMENSKRRISRIRGISMFTHMQRTESVGSVHIRSNRPDDPPAINFGFLDTQNDRITSILAVRKAREIMATQPIADVVGEELEPGPAVRTDDEILDYIRNNGQTTYHPVGSCRMGHDAKAVVDDRLRVHGIAGLRVADASIMPTIVSGNTSVPCMMIGEKCAAMVLEDSARVRRDRSDACPT